MLAGMLWAQPDTASEPFSSRGALAEPVQVPGLGRSECGEGGDIVEHGLGFRHVEAVPRWRAEVLDKDPGREADKRLVHAALKEMGAWEHVVDTAPAVSVSVALPASMDAASSEGRDRDSLGHDSLGHGGPSAGTAGSSRR